MVDGRVFEILANLATSTIDGLSVTKLFVRVSGDHQRKYCTYIKSYKPI